LIRAVVTQRSKKTTEEIEQIEEAVGTCREMQIAAMEKAKPGISEREIAGMMEGIAVSKGVRLAFPTIFSIHGETLHNIGCNNIMNRGDIAVNDSGAESSMHYAGDITRTIPIGGKFSQQQREIYQIVLQAQETAIAAIKPGIKFRQIHRLACITLLAGLKELGFIKTSPEEAVDAGVHTLFFPCGLGHMLGLDVHDMEALGEEFVGYTDKIKRRMEFGWQWLRLAKALETGYVITVEPGIYFIPVLIDRWKAEHKFSEFVNYEKVEKYGNFGGIRIEDDILVTEDGCRILGPGIPKRINEVEAITSQ
jgi:Xaa-Pro aminopeptidase